MTLTTGILIFDGVEELDFVGPWEVFGAAAMKQPNDRVATYAKEARPIRCAKGLVVVPDAALDAAPDLDVLLVPGGKGTRALLQDDEVLDWIREKSRRARFTTSVCNGSLVLNAAGLLEGKRAITHWSCYDELRAIAPVTIVEGARYVIEGKIVTAAGVSAGIDMALWILGQVYDPEFARDVQKYIEYYPEPPYAS
jgi:transcriptional regulator GlxA family with amidase domain